MSDIAAVWRIAEDPARANARGGATPWAPCYRGRSGTRPGKAPIDLMLGSAFAVYGRERLDRLMNEAVGVLAPYVPADSIRRAHRRYGERGAPRDVSRMWRLAMLTLWLRARRAAVVTLPIERWSHKGETAQHLCPMAQDFAAAGIALAAIQDLDGL